MEPFTLEETFAKHEFTARYMLGSSDAETFSMKYLLSLADDECCALWDNLGLGYTETKGLPLLREEISRQIYSSRVKSSQILCFAGAEEAIYATMRCLLKPGDCAIVVTPCYQSLLSIARAVCDNGDGSATANESYVTTIRLEEEIGWSLDIDGALASAIIPGKTKMIICNFPHNPTGAHLTQTEFDKLIALAEANDLWLFSDEVYRGMEVAGESSRLACCASVYDKGISLGVLSKAVGLAGLRVGWLACRDVFFLHTLAANYKHYLSICNSAPSEILALIAFRNYKILLDRNMSILVRNLHVIETGFLQRHSSLFEWKSPKGGCVGYMHYKGTRLTLDELAERLVTDYGLLIIPGCNFPGEYLQHCRFGFGRANFLDALAVFEKAIDEIMMS
jgi:aspartate/methionine/tyrosine aminotransferase